MKNKKDKVILHVEFETNDHATHTIEGNMDRVAYEFNALDGQMLDPKVILAKGVVGKLRFNASKFQKRLQREVKRNEAEYVVVRGTRN